MTTDRTDVDRARAELAATLNAIEYRLNVPKRATERVRRLSEENPLALGAIAAAAAAVVGAFVWLTVRLVRR
ncbi:DUF3618 domain-containing protein [Leifsonia sp. AG29]|uniref:DUF3618 domain-containing protein n=1 Tax=Leifsonia sp. AG29 TaxID=2598860 RepID=UPI00131C5FA6|nr:DUF3618 domain-containing protein [Leifsonia sp. AG29]